MTEPMKLRMKETSTITKYAPGVDPNDPASIPEEVIVEERYLTDEELIKLFGTTDAEKIVEQIKQSKERTINGND